MTPFQPKQQQIQSWSEFVTTVAELGPDWIFRGDLEGRGLVTALERACKSWKIPLKSAPEIERQLVREFKRHPEAAELGLEQNDDLSWYAAMQHLWCADTTSGLDILAICGSALRLR
ncbi:MAG: hypothetical protein ABL970_08745 [Nitrospira sp.]